MTEINVGDKVRIVDTSTSFLKGSIGLVGEVVYCYPYSVRVRFDHDPSDPNPDDDELEEVLEWWYEIEGEVELVD